MFVGRLRKKLGSDLIETVRGLAIGCGCPGMRRNPLAFRLVASAAVWCALWLSAGGYALSALFGNAVERNFDAHLGVLLEGLVAGSELNAERGLELRRNSASRASSSRYRAGTGRSRIAAGSCAARPRCGRRSRPFLSRLES